MYKKDKAPDRFVVVYQQLYPFRGNPMCQIIRDRVTGVNYLTYSGSITPLLDAEGKPVVTPLPKP